LKGGSTLIALVGVAAGRSVEGEETMTSNHGAYATLTTVSTEMEAQLLVNVLNDRGIAAVVTGEFASQLLSAVPIAVGVLVEQESLSVARSVLTEHEQERCYSELAEEDTESSSDETGMTRVPTRRPDDNSLSLTNDSSDENGQDSIGQDSGCMELGEGLWSPPQFGLRSLMIAVTAICLVCAVIKSLELSPVYGCFGLAILGTLTWLLIGLYRLVWCSGPVVDQKAKAVLRPPADYTNPDDALAAAFQLDMQGDWDAAIALYGDVARRWPEHGQYAQGCITQVQEKRSRI
jgi:hypothetical protein